VRGEAILIALTREVPASITSFELTHLERVPIDLEIARQEHAAYERALADAGCEVRQLASPGELSDAVFIEDTAVVLPELAIVTRPGAATRRDETTVVAAALRALRPVAEISAPATLDGGDVLVIDRTAYVGASGRTNAEGIAQLRTLIAPHGYRVQTIPVHGCLHLKSAVTLIAPDLVLINPTWIDGSRLVGVRALKIDETEPFAANALLIGERVLHAEHFPKTRELLEWCSIDVIAVPARELAKAEGGVTCCCLLVS
jgi:dimethylargininase